MLMLFIRAKAMIHKAKAPRMWNALGTQSPGASTSLGWKGCLPWERKRAMKADKFSDGWVWFLNKKENIVEKPEVYGEVWSWKSWSRNVAG